jgi:hypothetical protein
MDNITAARLEILAAKSRILADKYKGNQLWDGELSSALTEIEAEISVIRRDNRPYSDNKSRLGNTWFPDDK